MWCGTRTRSTWRRGSTSRWAWWAGASPALSLAAAAAPAHSERHARAPLFRPPSASPHPPPHSFGFANVSPRELLTGFVGTLVQVEGIVTKCAHRAARRAQQRAPAGSARRASDFPV